MARIGILSASRYELPTDLRHRKHRRIVEYHIGDNDYGVRLTGIGQVNAFKGARRICQGYHPDMLVFLGICGGVREDLKVGDLVLANRVLYYGSEIVLDAEILEKTRQKLFDLGIEHKIGPYETFNSAILSKARISRGVAAVDMESYLIANEAQKQGIPLLIAKVVSDIIPENQRRFFPRTRLLIDVLGNLKVAKPKIDEFFEAFSTKSL
jgi:nucleoside phosphorylase